MLYELVCTEYKRLQDQINLLERQIKELPEGTLICSRNGKYYKWYLHNETGTRYLAKEELELAKKLALKKYYRLQLQNLLHEKLALKMYLKHHRTKQDPASQLLIKNAEYRNLLASHFKTYSEELQDWMDTPYEKNPNHPEQLIHKTISGHILRSKSEALIDLALYQHHIPYRYEAPLILNEITIYPDFTLRHPETGQQFYWEHFGMMDSPNYAKNAFNKMQLYNEHGLIPSVHLITTFETSECPLTSEFIEKIINHYILN